MHLTRVPAEAQCSLLDHVAGCGLLLSNPAAKRALAQPLTLLPLLAETCLCCLNALLPRYRMPSCSC